MSGRWGRRVAVLLVLLTWLAIGGVGGPAVGRLSEAQQNDDSAYLPQDAESTRVRVLAARFAGSGALPYLVVVERAAGLTVADRSAVQSWLGQVPGLTFRADRSLRLGSYLTAPPTVAVPSEDGLALLVPVLMDGDKADDTIAGETSPLFEGAAALRESALETLTPTGLAVYVTGPGGVLADFVTAFAGIDGILLGVALGVVFLILLVVYRSPILPFAVLLTAVFGLALAALVIFPLAKNGVLGLNGQSQGILSILVVGGATDYALLLVSRYREELHDHESRWDAMRVAWRAAVEPIAASAATVVLGLLCMLLSELGNNRGLGPVGAIGIVGAVVAALTFLPAVLLVFGRAVFWPVVPRLDHVRAQDAVGRWGLWGRVAGLVGRSPRKVWVVTLLTLLACAALLPTFKAEGISQAQLFRDRVESVTGQDVLVRHFPGGSGSPAQVVVAQDQAARVQSVVKGVPGVVSVSLAADQPGGPAKVVDGRVLVEAVLTPPADSPEAEQLVRQLRTALDDVGEGVLVGGSTAEALDVREASQRDLRVILPAILAVIFVVLVLLLRSLVAPLVLVAANVVSFAATMGVAALAFNHVFGFPGSDPATPLYAFVFLVALGIDYTIFLMTRVREETRHRRTREGILVGLAVTGGVITSAGVVLAATFSALAVIPILFLVQIAFLVAFGVLLDTLVVRSLLVPALGHDLGARLWWPGRLDRPKGRHEKP